jgi:hypothetical protein
LVSSAAGQKGGFLLFVSTLKKELLPELSVATAVGAVPEPWEKPPGTVEGVAKA